MVFQVKRLSHLGVKVRDLRRSIEFYERVLGFRLYLDYRNGALPGHDTVVGMVGDVAIELVHDDHTAANAPVDPDGVGWSCVSFGVDDIDVAVASLRADGVDVTDPLQFPAARCAFFRDPDLNLLEVIELPGDATALSDLYSGSTSNAR